tara:strand:+ start:2194 stop:2430 length:237 start_codon:yes stop_codon:yes gene_type:complete
VATLAGLRLVWVILPHGNAQIVHKKTNYLLYHALRVSKPGMVFPTHYMIQNLQNFSVRAQVAQQVAQQVGQTMIMKST